MMQVTFNIGNAGLSLRLNEELIVKIYTANTGINIR